MTQLAVASNPAFDVSRIELDRQGTSYMVDTVGRLRDEAPDDNFFLIIGGDSLAEFTTWREPETIVRQAPLLVYRRLGLEPSTSPIERTFPDRVHFAEAPELDIASETIRQRVRAGETIRYLVPESVRDYIRKHELYQ
jgi:nicotinate-nucleotide adenylyltransferase